MFSRGCKLRAARTGFQNSGFILIGAARAHTITYCPYLLSFRTLVPTSAK